MSLFKPAENTVAYLKSGILGFQGSGKTRTGSEIAIGLHQYIKSKHPVYFFDTELGSSYVKGLFDDKKIPLMRIQSKAFLTMMQATQEIPEGAIFLIDSITHPWRDLMTSFMKKNGVNRIKMHHWGQLKSEWSQFNNFFLNSKAHIIMCGRAGFEFDFEEDEEGNKDLVKTGVKMKTEGELGFEPSLLIEMMMENKIEKGHITGIVNKAFILKDRFGIMNGQMYTMPTFETFLPHITMLNLNGNHEPLDGADSQSIFNTDNSVAHRLKQRDILMEELENELSLRFNSRTDEGKTALIKLLKDMFGTSSKTAISNFPNEKIKEKLEELKKTKIIKDK